MGKGEASRPSLSLSPRGPGQKLAGRWLWALTSGELWLCTPPPGLPLKICYLLEVVRLRGRLRLGVQPDP